MFKRIDHIALECADLAASISFYEKIFGFEEYFRHPTPTGVTIAYLRLQDTVLELIDRAASHTDGFHFCLEADNFDDAVAHLEKRGLPVHMAPHDTPPRAPREANWRRAVFLGPDGEQIEIRGDAASL